MRAVAAVVLATGCVAGTGSAREAIVGGSADDGDPAVVALAGAPAACGEPPGASCSGALIAPRVVLTAAHCVMRPDPSLVVVLGASTDAATELHQVLETHVAPGFDDATHTNDLALLVLDHPSSVAPLALAAAAAPERVGDPVRVVGFGADGPTGAVGLKRTGAAQVSMIAAADFQITPSPAMTCSGDSGGPVLWTGASGEVVAGVTSYGDPGCAQFADNADVGGAHAFIDPVVAAAAAAPEAHGDGPIGRGEVCETACTGDADCPAGFSCTSDPSGARRCTIPGQTGGDLGDACSTDQACASGTCAALPAGGGCACSSPCAAGQPPAAATGCCESSQAPPPLGSLLLVALVLVGDLGRLFKCTTKV